jgi:hypothetical protein
VFSFAFAISSAMTAHYEAQFVFWNDLSTMLSDSIHKTCEANLRLGEGIFGTAWKLQPATAGEGTRLGLGKIVAYRQHIALLGADLQVAIARVRTRHALETTRTAQTLANQVTHTITDHAEQQVGELSKAADLAFQGAREQEDTDQAGRNMHAEGHVDAAIFPSDASAKTFGKTVGSHGSHV